MRLAIHDYSQEVAASMVDTVTEKGKKKSIAIDAADLLILDWFTKFYPFMDKREIEGKEYGWIKRSKVIEDLPILRISEGAVSDRLKKLVHFKLLDYKLVKDAEGTRCYYTHGESYPQLVFDFSTIGEWGYRVKPTQGIGSNQHRVSGQTPYKDSGLDSSLNRKGNEGKMNCGKPANSRCECGGLIAKNIQTGIYECGNCQKKFPMSQKDEERIAMFDRMKEM